MTDSSSVEILNYSVLNEVIKFILSDNHPVIMNGLLTAPDFSEKIRFNGLNEGIGTLLRTGSYHAGTLEKFFELNSDFAKQELRDKICEIYTTSQKKDFPELLDGVSKPDLTFFDVLKSIMPKETREFQNAAVILMAYYFESCDIFEEPPKRAIAE